MTEQMFRPSFLWVEWILAGIVVAAAVLMTVTPVAEEVERGRGVNHYECGSLVAPRSSGLRVERQAIDQPPLEEETAADNECMRLRRDRKAQAIMVAGLGPLPLWLGLRRLRRREVNISYVLVAVLLGLTWWLAVWPAAFNPEDRVATECGSPLLGGAISPASIENPAHEPTRREVVCGAVHNRRIAIALIPLLVAIPVGISAARKVEGTEP